MFREISISKMQIKMQNKELDPMDVVNESITKYKKSDNKFKSFINFDEDVLIKKAESTRLKISNNEDLSPLECMPIGVKDIFNTSDYPTQMGSALWKDFTPGNDARVVYNLKNSGAVVAGKTVTAEFAVHQLNETLNPHDIKLTPGTSSSGSAVAIALGIVPISIGTQTAGSIIRPASFCGVYGCKPSFGLIPRTATLKTTDTLDTIGFFSSFPEDLKIIFDACRVHGPNFPISHKAFLDTKRQTNFNNRPWRIGFLKNDCWSVTPDYAKQEIIDFVNKAAITPNIEISEVTLPSAMETTRNCHKTIYNKALSYYFAEEFKDKDFISPVMNELIQEGSKISPEDYHSALKNQNNLINIMDNFMNDYDAIITLSTSGEAPLREVEEINDSALMWTLTHMPVVSAPNFKSPDNIPFGLQITARKYNDILLFNLIDYLISTELIPNTCNPKFD
jgi:Asp-tRNA(Asn)/Glu-tRNA(Gln) amidotransferase A subunit family amidase